MIIYLKVPQRLSSCCFDLVMVFVALFNGLVVVAGRGCLFELREELGRSMNFRYYS